MAEPNVRVFIVQSSEKKEFKSDKFKHLNTSNDG